MYDDDSRGLESPDRPHALTDDWNTRARPDGGTTAPEDSSDDSTHLNDVDPDAAGYRLEVIDHQATKLLETLADDRTDEPHEATRHLREIRAEVEWARRGLCESPGESGSAAVDSTAGSEAQTGESDCTDDLEDRTDEPDSSNHAAYSTDDGVLMIAHRGPHVTTVFGPDPAAYERSLESGGPDAGDGERDRDGDDSRDDGGSRGGDADCADGTDGADGTDDTDGTGGTIDTRDPDVSDDTDGIDDTDDATDTEPTHERSDTRDPIQPRDGGDRDDE